MNEICSFSEFRERKMNEFYVRQTDRWLGRQAGRVAGVNDKIECMYLYEIQS